MEMEPNPHEYNPSKNAASVSRFPGPACETWEATFSRG
jgi:hypothetical protein